jgi:hypothetical protein
MRCEPAQQLTTAARIVDVQQDVRTIIGLGPIAQHRRLNVVELNTDGAALKLAAEAIYE